MYVARPPHPKHVHLRSPYTHRCALPVAEGLPRAHLRAAPPAGGGRHDLRGSRLACTLSATLWLADRARRAVHDSYALPPPYRCKGSGRAAAKAHAEQAAKPKCCEINRGGEPCEQTRPCPFHGTVKGQKRCASTLDSDPFQRCKLQCSVGTLFCDKHQEWPDLGPKAGMYADRCLQKGTPVVMKGFAQWAYPGASTTPEIYDLERSSESLRLKMSQ